MAFERPLDFFLIFVCADVANERKKGSKVIIFLLDVYRHSKNGRSDATKCTAALYLSYK